jgi:hypothetical protein
VLGGFAIQSDAPRKFTVKFVVQRILLYLGLAFGFLILMGCVLFVRIHTGIKIPVRWFGLAIWTPFTFWFVARGFSRKTYSRPAFYIVLTALLTAHVAIFSLILRGHPARRAVWFPFVALVEAPVLSSGIELAVQDFRLRFHSDGAHFANCDPTTCHLPSRFTTTSM